MALVARGALVVLAANPERVARVEILAEWLAREALRAVPVVVLVIRGARVVRVATHWKIQTRRCVVIFGCRKLTEASISARWRVVESLPSFVECQTQ